MELFACYPFVAVLVAVWWVSQYRWDRKHGAGNPVLAIIMGALWPVAVPILITSAVRSRARRGRR